MTQPSSQLNVGDVVTISDAPGALTWTILAITEEATANGPLYTLESGQTGRRRYTLGDNLTTFTPKRTDWSLE